MLMCWVAGSKVVNIVPLRIDGKGSANISVANTNSTFQESQKGIRKREEDLKFKKN